jgi:hypothetical protein
MIDSSAALASLYQGPLAEFIARRRLAVSQLKGSGHKDVAAGIGGAQKPSRTAHLVNQVFWRARPVYDQLLDAGTAARAAQQARLLGDPDADLPSTMALRDEAVRAAVEQALAIASAESLGTADGLSGPLRASFEALAAHGREGRLPHGHLTDDVPLPGLQALAGLVLPAEPTPVRRFEIVARQAPAEGPSPTTPDPRRVEAEVLLAEARAHEDLSRERFAELERALSAASEVLADAERDLDAARLRVGAATQALEAGRNALEAAARDAAHQREVVAPAEAALAALSGTSGPEPPPAPARHPRR